jgi:hypothetical protein
VSAHDSFLTESDIAPRGSAAGVMHEVDGLLFGQAENRASSSCREAGLVLKHGSTEGTVVTIVQVLLITP